MVPSSVSFPLEQKRLEVDISAKKKAPHCSGGSLFSCGRDVADTRSEGANCDVLDVRLEVG